MRGDAVALMIARAIEHRLSGIKPIIVLGDEDSMELTSYQLGEKVALEWVLTLLSLSARGESDNV